jgi:osmotically-inducible protein OsmY
VDADASTPTGSRCHSTPARSLYPGQIETDPEKGAASRAAMRVRGVTAVADEIEVKNGWYPGGLRGDRTARTA